MAKIIKLGHRLRYPITILKLLKAPGASVRTQEPLMQYSFKWMRTVGDHILGDTWEEEQTTIADWDSPVEGKIERWRVKEGQVVARDGDCIDVDEACSHEIQFRGLCAICGKDMTEVNWASDSRDTERAPINMTHDHTSLKVSTFQARRAEAELQRRLLEQRKLSLVVDLDQTIIHACIEPTIGEWQQDPENPNYDSVKEVRSFQLNDDGPRGLASGCWYYIKLRPRLEEFLRKVADMYELHVYTMGTRAYALNVAKIVDPQQKLFGNRVISRDENGSMTAKSLDRLFPVSTNMVVIIDDRADVWPANRKNLIKVTPYDFFKGIGDINSSFLPRREDLLASVPAAIAPSPAKTNLLAPPPDIASAAATQDKKLSALEELVNMSGSDDPSLTKRQIEEQARTLEAQIKDRPLLHMQEKLDKEDEEAGKSTTETVGNDEQPPAAPPHQRHHLLLDDDHELLHLEEHLTALHKKYYDEYGRIAASKPSQMPDVGLVLNSLKAKVLKGTKLVLSGLVPIGVDVRRSELGLQVSSFGAELRDRVSRDITHLVVSSSRPRTQKVRQAAKFASIKIVNQDWLAETLTQWKMVDETPYLVDIHPADRGLVKDQGSLAPSTETTDAEPVSDADDTEDTVAAKPRPLRIKRPRLQIASHTGQSRDLDKEPDSEDDVGDIDQDEEGLMPSVLADGQLSPVDGLKTFNWNEADEELDQFLASGSDDDDDDEEVGRHGDGEEEEEVDDDEGMSTDKGDGTNGDGVAREEGSRKRKHGGVGEKETSEADSLDESSSSLAKKQRLAKDRSLSYLRAQYNADDDSSLPTPQITGDEGDVSRLKGDGHHVSDHPGETAAGDGVNDDDDTLEINEEELEADLLAEFEAEEREMEALELQNEKG